MDVTAHSGPVTPSLYAGDGPFGALADAIPHIVFTTTPDDGRITYFNRRWFEYSGLTPDETYVDFGYRRAVHPDDLEQLQACGKRARLEGVESSTDARYRRRDGAYRWHRVTAVPSRAADGEIVAWIGTVVDVHDERSADRAFKTMSTSLPFLLWTATPEGEIDYTNDRWHDYLDESSPRLRHIMHPNDAPEVLEAWSHSLSTGEPFAQVMRVRNRQGMYRWHRATATPFYGEQGAIERWYGVTFDIHDEQLVRESVDADVESRVISDVTRNTPVLMFTMDPAGKVLSLNERWAQLTGKPLEQLLGWGISEIVEPADLKRIGVEFRSRAPSDNEVVLRYRIRDSEGRYRWIETRSVPQRNHDGTILGWTGVGIEIEEHVRSTAMLEFLLSSGADVSAQTDIPSLMRALASRVIENLADECVLDLLADTGGIERVVVRRGEAYDKDDRVDPDPIISPEQRHPVADAIFRGKTTFAPLMDEAFLAQCIDDPYRRERWSLANSVIVAPIRTSEKIYGSIAIIRKGTPQPFQFSDMQVVEDVGRRVGLTLANIELARRARRESEGKLDQFRRIADFAPQLMWTADALGNVDWMNQRWYEFTGQSPRDAIGGTGSASALHPEDGERTTAVYKYSIDTGAPFECEFRLRRSDGVYRWCIARAVCERDDHGAIVRWYGSTTDIDDSRRASRTLQVFAALGERLSESSGLDETFDAILDVLVSDFADAAIITLIDENDEFIVRAVHAQNRAQRNMLNSLIGTTHVSSDSTVGSRAAYLTGRPFIENELSEHIYRDGLTSLGLSIARRIGVHALAAIPLRATSGRIIGTLVLQMTDSSRRFEDDDVPFYMELARRITPAIANAELFERERIVAHSFQEAALPSDLPRIPGYEFDAVYEAGRAEALVGGDWFDAFALLDGRIVISIGDVAGAGLRAAVMMSNVRQAIRGVAQVHADPALMLEAADGAIRSQNPDTYVTAFVGVIDPMSNVIVYQSAGHPRPLLTLADGGVIELEGGGLPLGLRTDHEPHNAVQRLPVGSLLALYTDGLVEASHDIEDGYRRLLQAMNDSQLRKAVSPAKSLYDAMLPEGSKDDVAILTVRIGEATRGLIFPIASSRDEEAVRETRRKIFAELRAGGMSEQALLAAELIVAELIGNLTRYAPGSAIFTLAWNHGVPVLHLEDSGPGYEFAAKLPADPLSETGRGLFLIASLARNFVVTPRFDGGSHSRVVFKM